MGAQLAGNTARQPGSVKLRGSVYGAPRVRAAVGASSPSKRLSGAPLAGKRLGAMVVGVLRLTEQGGAEPMHAVRHSGEQLCGARPHGSAHGVARYRWSVAPWHNSCRVPGRYGILSEIPSPIPAPWR